MINCTDFLNYNQGINLLGSVVAIGSCPVAASDVTQPWTVHLDTASV